MARYALLLLDKYFSHNIWNFVPQYYTAQGKWPDLVLEQYIRRPGKNRDQLFVPKVYLEFKTQLNTKDAVAQLIEAIGWEYGDKFRSRGFLIGVKGTQWTIMDYKFLNVEGKPNPECVINNFYGQGVVQPERPVPIRTYNQFDFMDLKYPDPTKDLFKALEWIGQDNEPRDLTSATPNATRLTVSFTMSTIDSEREVPEEEMETSNSEREAPEEETIFLISSISSYYSER